MVSNGTKIGTTNIQQCVAVIIKGNDSTALAHFDRYTTTESLKKNIQQIFPQERSLDVRIYGAKDLVQKEISSNNMSAVLTTLYNLSENGYNINIISINTNLKLADVKTPILEAKWSDIVFDGQEIHEGDVLGDTTYCLRDVIRREFDSERNYKYEISENIIREADFYIFNINNYADIQKFIEDNGYYDFHISEQKLHQKLFNFLNYHNREYKFVFLHIGEFMMSYYQVYLITSLKEGLEQNPEMYVEHGLIADHNHSLGVTSQAEYKDVVAVSNSVMGSEYENNARSTSTSNAQNDKTDSKNSSSSLADSTISHAYKYLTTEVVGIGEFVEINDTTWEA